MSKTNILSVGDDRLARITKLRYISDPGFPVWDFSYANGIDQDGNLVGVYCPAGMGQVPKRYEGKSGKGRGVKAWWIDHMPTLGINPFDLGLHRAEVSTFQ